MIVASVRLSKPTPPGQNSRCAAASALQLGHTVASFYRSRATLTINSGASSALLTYYWDGTGAAPAALVTEQMARVRAFWNSLAATIQGGCTLVFNPVSDLIDEATGAIVGQDAGTLPAAVAFTGAGGYAPLQTQALLRLSTSSFVAGRRVTGRQFIPGLGSVSVTAGGNPAAALLTSLQTAANLLGTTVVTPTTQRVWHRPKAGVGGLSVPVSARTVASTFAILRSRRS